MKRYGKTISNAASDLNLILGNLNNSGYTREDLVSDINQVEKQLVDLVEAVTYDEPAYTGVTDSTRGKAYSRRVRIRHIRRKSEILKSTAGEDVVKFRGMLSKGKIHGTCRLYRGKSDDQTSISRLREDERTKTMLNEYRNGESED